MKTHMCSQQAELPTKVPPSNATPTNHRAAQATRSGAANTAVLGKARLEFLCVTRTCNKITKEEILQ